MGHGVLMVIIIIALPAYSFIGFTWLRRVVKWYWAFAGLIVVIPAVYFAIVYTLMAQAWILDQFLGAGRRSEAGTIWILFGMLVLTLLPAPWLYRHARAGVARR